MGYIGGITRLLTIDPNFQRDIKPRCLRYFQKTPRDISEREQRISWSKGMALDRWSGARAELQGHEVLWGLAILAGFLGGFQSHQLQVGAYYTLFIGSLEGRKWWNNP